MLNRWDPFADLNRLHDELFRQNREPVFRLAVDIREDEEAFFVEAEVPGLTAEDVNVDIEKGVLTIRGERKFDREESDETSGYRRIERSYGAFSRSFSLPETVDPEGIDADLKNGVLTVRLPKREAPGSRKIAVKAA